MISSSPDIKFFSDLLLDNVLIDTKEEYGKQYVILQESGISSFCRINNLPDDILVLKADAFPAPTTFFKGDRGECKRADFIMISEEKKTILYLEIKTGDKDSSYIKSQLKGSRCVMAYCKEAVEQFWGKKSFLSQYRHLYVGIVNLKGRKKPFCEKGPTRKHDSPDTFLKISTPPNGRIQFNQLIGK